MYWGPDCHSRHGKGNHYDAESSPIRSPAGLDQRGARGAWETPQRSKSRRRCQTGESEQRSGDCGAVWGWGGGTGPVPAGTVAGVAGASAGPRASARRAPLARIGGIAARAGGGPGREETASEGPAELCRACPVCPAFYSAGLQAFLFLEARQRNQVFT